MYMRFLGGGIGHQQTTTPAAQLDTYPVVDADEADSQLGLVEDDSAELGRPSHGNDAVEDDDGDEPAAVGSENVAGDEAKDWGYVMSDRSDGEESDGDGDGSDEDGNEVGDEIYDAGGYAPL